MDDRYQLSGHMICRPVREGGIFSILMKAPCYTKPNMASSTFKPNVRRSLFLALIFQIAWIATGLIALLLGAEVKWPLLFANLLTLWVPALFEFIMKARLPDSLQIHYYLFITASSLVGSALGGYAFIPNWDTIVHIDSGVLLAWLGMYAVRYVEETRDIRFPAWFAAFVILATPLAFAVLWEVYEFMSDLLIHTTMQAGGLEDTIVDMLAALVGGLIAIILATWGLTPKTMAPRVWARRDGTKK